MRIYAISANDVAFQRRSKKRNDEKREAQTFHEQSFQTFINNFGADNLTLYPEFQVQGAHRKSFVKNAHPYTEGYFDMDRILSLDAPRGKTDKPQSFEDGHKKFTLDKYQKEAIEAAVSGKTTIVTAPTGTGKTLIAEYIIDDSLKNNKKVIYLSPLKALSNEKYTDFAKLFGTYDKDGNLLDTKNVGLLTGDTVINPDAPLLVMTTEIYRNSLLANDKKVADVNYKDYDTVIYDEFHYMGEKQRGGVWEESVMNTPEHMKQIMLSATASNAEDIKGWVQELNPDIEAYLVNVPESERHVPLREFFLTRNESGGIVFENVKNQKLDLYQLTNRINISDRQLSALDEMKELTGIQTDEELNRFLKSLAGKKNELEASYLAKKLREKGVDNEKADAISLILSNKNSTTYKTTPDNEPALNVQNSKVISKLQKKNMLPALFYVFSKKGCNKELENAAGNSESLLTPEESRKVYDEVQKAKEKGVFLGSDFDGKQLEYLMKGFATHHAGKLPAYKSLVENLARQGLVKVCFATDTLLAGINMPFRTTVFTSMDKFDGDEIVDIPPSSFKQGAGRAGRRGKDEIGNVIIMPKKREDYDKYVLLSKSKDTPIRSQYHPSYASVLSDRMLNCTDETLLRTMAANQSSRKLGKLEELTNNRLYVLEMHGYIEKTPEGKYKRTEKGELAKNVFGINEMFLTELLTDESYLKDFTDVELTALCAMLSDVKDENPSKEFKGEFSYLNDAIYPAVNLMEKIDTTEEVYGIKKEPTPMSTNLVPYILEFAEALDDRDEAIKSWCDIMNDLRENNLLYHNGDFLRVINGTIDILKLIHELSPDENIRNEASIAMSKLTKAPVVDIFNYELKDDKNEEKEEN